MVLSQFEREHICINCSKFFSQETSEYMVLNDEMELEMDELNQHECMAPLTTLIKHMQRNQITPKVEEASMNQKFGIVSLVITKQQSCD